VKKEATLSKSSSLCVGCLLERYYVCVVVFGYGYLNIIIINFSNSGDMSIENCLDEVVGIHKKSNVYTREMLLCNYIIFLNSKLNRLETFNIIHSFLLSYS